mmetsp:Transcript_46822/g.102320  ORF Transcript_46822/g.102320 Transcript_46822/m.102320 type:complete len:225 (+) Transcript_46822:979-1653(+)
MRQELAQDTRAMDPQIQCDSMSHRAVIASEHPDLHASCLQCSDRISGLRLDSIPHGDQPAKLTINANLNHCFPLRLQGHHGLLNTICIGTELQNKVLHQSTCTDVDQVPEHLATHALARNCLKFLHGIRLSCSDCAAYGLGLNGPGQGMLRAALSSRREEEELLQGSQVLRLQGRQRRCQSALLRVRQAPEGRPQDDDVCDLGLTLCESARLVEDDVCHAVRYF